MKTALELPHKSFFLSLWVEPCGEPNLSQEDFWLEVTGDHCSQSEVELISLDFLFWTKGKRTDSAFGMVDV